MFMFTATMPPSIQSLARKYMRQELVVTIGEEGLAVSKIEQHVEVMEKEGDRLTRLETLLLSIPPPIIIFTNSKAKCDELQRRIGEMTGNRIYSSDENYDR